MRCDLQGTLAIYQVEERPNSHYMRPGKTHEALLENSINSAAKGDGNDLEDRWIQGTE